MAARPWIVPDELWELIEPLLPAHPRRLRYPGRKRLAAPTARAGLRVGHHLLATPRRGRARSTVAARARGTTCSTPCRRYAAASGRRADTHEAFPDLACCMICFRRLGASL